MAFMSVKAWRARSAERKHLADGLKRDLRTALGLTEADTLAINEIACPDPDCPDLETIVLVMRVGEPTRALRIRKTMEAVAASDLSALAEDEGRRRAAGEP